MRLLTVRSPFSEPCEHKITPGVTKIGRQENSDINLTSSMISRVHAEIYLDRAQRRVTLKDLSSTNGTYVNRQRIPSSKELLINPEDVIRMGPYELNLANLNLSGQLNAIAGNTPVTESIVLEALDRHAILLHEIIGRLSKVYDIDQALGEIAKLMKRSLGVDVVKIFLKNQFQKIPELGFPTTYADRVIQNQEAIFIPNLIMDSTHKISASAGRLKINSLLCVPIILKNQVIGLVYLYNTSSLGRQLSNTDLNIAIAVAHLAGLTLERVRLIAKEKEQARMQLLLQRLLPITSVDSTLTQYLKTGHLPELSERKVTVLFSDIIKSTHMAEKLGPHRFGAILERYYQEMTKIIFEYGGVIDKYLGDGVMAIFGMDGDCTDVENRAIKAGLQILNTIETKFRRDEDPVNVGVSINSGVVMAGYMETQHRVELSVFGDTVNVADRLQKLARPNRLFIGPSTRNAINENYKLQNVGSVEIRGRTEPIQIHEVIRE
ncbi:MAG: adenylate/guanylate cyclase domain-containing protein, partial [Chloroflexota bacterium]